MLYANIVLGLPIDGPFDYIVPPVAIPKIKIGSRVRINFANRQAVGYVIGLSKKTTIKGLKEILEVLDESPILSESALNLTKKISGYYCCSWGEAIEAQLPEVLRKGKAIEATGTVSKESYSSVPGSCPLSLLIHDLNNSRWEVYSSEIKKVLDANKSAIVILPDINSINKVKEKILPLTSKICLLYRKQPKEAQEWLRIKQGEVNVVIGTRSAIFAPLETLGLIIIDEEEDSVYKQEQVPHYHTREVAFMRAELERAKVVLGSSSPSLESFLLVKEKKLEYLFIPRKKAFPEIKIMDMKRLPFSDWKRRLVFSKFLEDAVYAVLNAKGKTLIFMNRKGFATSATCHNCGIALKCPRCNTNLVYHFKENILTCHYCVFKMELPKICPECNSGYIKLGGTGIEKIESELARIFPQARIKLVEKEEHLDIDSADIFIATQYIFKEKVVDFNLIGVLAIDNSLNRMDFRAGEKVFGLLVGLCNLTKEKMIIQTTFPEHQCFKALEQKDVKVFYDEELKQRKQLQFPPFKHFSLLKIRGKDEGKVKDLSQKLFDKLNTKDTGSVKVISLNPGQPEKLRGNFYWQILISCDNINKAAEFLKLNLKNIRHSGIIITVDMDI